VELTVVAASGTQAVTAQDVNIQDVPNVPITRGGLVTFEAAHAAGHTAYAEKIAPSLRQAFYPQSTSSTLGPARADGRP
jgi:hypothetical protein